MKTCEHEEKPFSTIKFVSVILANIIITLAEIIGGFFSRSLALLSDALHNFGDVTAVGLSFFASRIAIKTRDAHKTYGYKRAEILTAFINSTSLIVLSFFLIFETIKRLKKPEKIDANLMFVIGVIGLIANLFSTLILKKDTHKSLNIKSSYLHLLGDTLSSIVVVLGALVIKFFNLYWFDPVITFFICGYIIWESYKITKKTTDILMQSAAELDYTEMKREIEALSGVRNIHHVHTWMGNEKTIYLEAHVEMEDMLLSKTCDIAEKIEKLLKEKYNIDHMTIQFETDRCSEKEFFNKK